MLVIHRKVDQELEVASSLTHRALSHRRQLHNHPLLQSYGNREHGVAEEDDTLKRQAIIRRLVDLGRDWRWWDRVGTFDSIPLQYSAWSPRRSYGDHAIQGSYGALISPLKASLQFIL
jgi:hypothetical protein